MAMDWSLLWEWIAIVILVLLSGLFSGLNLGLMGLDPVDLEVVIAGGKEPNSSYAKKIKPLRDCGNWLLCTLLLGNVAVNTALSILLADKSDALIGFIISTIVIVVFGEIIPQALCSRFALKIGAKTVQIVWFLMAAISFAAYPIAMILDKLLGQELGTIYSTAELRKLVDIHARSEGTAVNQRTANIMKGALGLQETKIKDVMTKIQDVFWLDENATLNFDVLTQIFKSGHSRIPIMRKSIDGNDLRIVGMLYAKDLILLDPDDEISVLHVMNAFRYKKPLFLSENITLDACLKIFVHSRQHLCMVKSGTTGSITIENDENKNDDTNDGEINVDMSNLSELRDDVIGSKRLSYFDEYLQNLNNQDRFNNDDNDNGDKIDSDPISIGIITLEDVIEHALQTELVDEHDVFVDHKHTQKTNRLSKIDWSVLQLFDHRQKMMTSLPPQELQAVYHFLGQSIKVFMVCTYTLFCLLFFHFHTNYRICP